MAYRMASNRGNTERYVNNSRYIHIMLYGWRERENDGMRNIFVYTNKHARTQHNSKSKVIKL